jgi:hypothetical protein
MMIMPPDTGPNQAASADPDHPDHSDHSDHPDDPPVLPDRSPADSDAAWGDEPEPDDDERLTLDRPPHWDSA